MGAGASTVGTGLPPGTGGWWLERQQRDPHRRRSALTVERVVEAGLGLLGREGFEALTMRRLAQVLGCGQASLYRHVSGREELMVLMADEVRSRAVQRAPSSAGWRESLAWTARRYRAFLLEHPALVPLIGSSHALGPGALAGREHALELLVGDGFEPAAAITAYSVLATYLAGSVNHVAGMVRASEAEQEARRRWYAAQDPHAHPHLVRDAALLAATTDQDVFEVGLTMVLDGIAALRGSQEGRGALRPATPPGA